MRVCNSGHLKQTLWQVACHPRSSAGSRRSSITADTEQTCNNGLCSLYSVFYWSYTDALVAARMHMKRNVHVVDMSSIMALLISFFLLAYTAYATGDMAATYSLKATGNAPRSHTSTRISMDSTTSGIQKKSIYRRGLLRRVGGNGSPAKGSRCSSVSLLSIMLFHATNLNFQERVGCCQVTAFCGAPITAKLLPSFTVIACSVT